jgi:hypothetical protein
MTFERALLEKVKALPPDKQQEILDFAEFLYQKMQGKEREPNKPQADPIWELGAEPTQLTESDAENNKLPKPSLGKRLRAIRAKIVESGEGLLTIDEIEQEMAEQRARLGHLSE